jgi:hypothetical protein
MNLYVIMSLVELINNSFTDKNTTHSYLGLYETLLSSKKYTAKNVLEVGIHRGGSIKLWYDYFQNATIHGIDINGINMILNDLRNKERIKLYTSSNAYDFDFFKTKLLNTNIKFDMVLDDGPHTLESMKKFIMLYSQLLCDDGILIIEDVQSWNWIEILKECVPDDLKSFIQVYDLRENKNRYDDIVFVINKKL